MSARCLTDGEFDVAPYLRQVQVCHRECVTAAAAYPGRSAGIGEGEDEVDLGGAVYEYEPTEEAILAELLPRNVSVQLFKALLENAASEQEPV